MKLRQATIATLALAIAVTALVLTTAPVAAQDELVEVDDNHELNTDQAIEEYNTTGNVSAELQHPRMTITVAEESEDAGLDGFHADAVNDYVRFNYHHDAPVTLRIYLAEDYIRPRTANDLTAENADVRADVTPVKGTTHMMMKVRFTGQTDATFKLSKEAGWVFGYVDEYNKRLNESTGWQVPSVFGSGEPWHYISPDQFGEADEATFVIERPEDVNQGEIMVQYDADPKQRSETWLPVTSCSSDRDTRVCTFDRSGAENKTYLLSQDANDASVRYKYDHSRLEQVKASLRDLAHSRSRFVDWVDDVWGDLW